ncbi:hypothetical protein PsYK624_128580 [Phanerochaete sordida]|uniref:Uncharacterized protein n=1 Tax=Phanerochaete sordida TaxID=48140 RepID=A0A9P3LJX6_9APHY|nr:hypothetical protein PsYK624_128580 [Phanerochaete sordida]
MCARRGATLVGARARLWLAAGFAPASSSRSQSARGLFDALSGACLVSLRREPRPAGQLRRRRRRRPMNFAAPRRARENGYRGAALALELAACSLRSDMVSPLKCLFVMGIRA